MFATVLTTITTIWRPGFKDGVRKITDFHYLTDRKHSMGISGVWRGKSQTYELQNALK